MVFKFDGGPSPDTWAAGWWAGPDGDLICVKPNIKDWWESHQLLSPICTHPLTAILAFFLKYWLALFDKNMKKTWKGNRTYEEYGRDDYLSLGKRNMVRQFIIDCLQCNEELFLYPSGWSVGPNPPHHFHYIQAECANGHSSVRCMYEGKVGWFHNAVIAEGKFPTFRYLDGDLMPAEEFERWLRQDNSPMEDPLDPHNTI